MTTLLGLLALALCCIGIAADKLQDDSPDAPQSKAGALDALLFALCLVSMLAKRARDAEDDDF